MFNLSKLFKLFKKKSPKDRENEDNIETSKILYEKFCKNNDEQSDNEKENSHVDNKVVELDL